MTGKTVKFRRFAAGTSPVKQANRAAPERCGWWVLPAGYERFADNVPSGNARRWITLEVPAGALIYSCINRKGVLTRDGFFNIGPWNLMTAEDAMLALKRHISYTRAVILTDPRWQGYVLKRGLDASSLQCFIPKNTRVR